MSNRSAIIPPDAHRASNWVPVGLRGYERAWLAPDFIAGLTLAAVAIPECIGYTKIAGTPVVTGLYTILLPLAVFALLGSSRHLVVGADSATAAILFAALSSMAHPFTARWVTLTSAAALTTAAFLLAATVLRLGFLADFLSRTVLVGFLSGVGVSVVISQLPDVLRIGVQAHESLRRLFEIAAQVHLVHVPTLLMAASVIAIIVILERIAPAAPGPLVAIALAIAATWAFHLDRHGVQIIGPVQAGLPAIRIPRGVDLADLRRLLPTAASMFLVIVAQSAATARSFAQRHGEPFDENRDLFALAASNAAAGLSSTFVVNGSPTKTAIGEAAGARTQVAQLITAAIVLVVLLAATSIIRQLPHAALAALVVLIGIRLIDVDALRQICQFRRVTFLVAIATLCAVVALGVEQGIFVAIGLSVLDHLRQEYRPKDVILTVDDGRVRPVAATPGVESQPGLIVYRFSAPLFFANADYFSARVQALTTAAPHSVKWFVFDLISMDDIDYTGGLALMASVRQLRQQRIVVAFVEIADIRDTLDRLKSMEGVGPDRMFESVQESIEAFSREVRTAG